MAVDITKLLDPTSKAFAFYKRLSGTPIPRALMFPEEEVECTELWMKHEAIVHYCGGRDKIEVLQQKIKQCNGRRKQRILKWDTCAIAIANLIMTQGFAAHIASGFLTGKQKKAVHYFSSTSLPNTSCFMAVRCANDNFVMDCRRGLAYSGHEISSAYPEIKDLPWNTRELSSNAIAYYSESFLSAECLASLMAWAEANG